ncbi:MAG: DUF4180 domain-containing protein [Chloroflexota bacterium]
MTYTLIEQNGKTYLECLPGMAPIAGERDALDLVALCGEHEMHRLLLHGIHLPPAFFDLKTGLAGEVLLKFSNYRIKVAAVVTPDQVGTGRFAEMAMESNHFDEFGVFYARPAAERWLLRD